MKTLGLCMLLFSTLVIIQSKPLNSELPHSREFYAGYIKAITDNFDQLFETDRQTRSTKDEEELSKSSHEAAKLTDKSLQKVDKRAEITNQEKESNAINHDGKNVKKRDEEKQYKKRHVQDKVDEDSEIQKRDTVPEGNGENYVGNAAINEKRNDINNSSEAEQMDSENVKTDLEDSNEINVRNPVNSEERKVGLETNFISAKPGDLQIEADHNNVKKTLVDDADRTTINDEAASNHDLEYSSGADPDENSSDERKPSSSDFEEDAFTQSNKIDENNAKKYDKKFSKSKSKHKKPRQNFEDWKQDEKDVHKQIRSDTPLSEQYSDDIQQSNDEGFSLNERKIFLDEPEPENLMFQQRSFSPGLFGYGFLRSPFSPVGSELTFTRFNSFAPINSFTPFNAIAMQNYLIPTDSRDSVLIPVTRGIARGVIAKRGNNDNNNNNCCCCSAGNGNNNNGCCCPCHYTCSHQDCHDCCHCHHDVHHHDCCHHHHVTHCHPTIHHTCHEHHHDHCHPCSHHECHCHHPCECKHVHHHEPCCHDSCNHDNGHHDFVHDCCNYDCGVHDCGGHQNDGCPNCCSNHNLYGVHHCVPEYHCGGYEPHYDRPLCGCGHDYLSNQPVHILGNNYGTYGRVDGYLKRKRRLASLKK